MVVASSTIGPIRGPLPLYRYTPHFFDPFCAVLSLWYNKAKAVRKMAPKAINVLRSGKSRSPHLTPGLLLRRINPWPLPKLCLPAESRILLGNLFEKAKIMASKNTYTTWLHKDSHVHWPSEPQPYIAQPDENG